MFVPVVLARVGLLLFSGKQLGKEIGYWMRGDRKGDEDTQLWYMTSYTLLLHLLNKRMNCEFTHVILDEFHERYANLFLQFQ